VRDLGTAKQLNLNMKEVRSSNGANLGFEAKMRKAIEERKNVFLRRELDSVLFAFIRLANIFSVLGMATEIVKKRIQLN
jgi:hypothetical protein